MDTQTRCAFPHSPTRRMRERASGGVIVLFRKVQKTLKLSSRLFLFAAGVLSAQKRIQIGTHLPTMKPNLARRIESVFSKSSRKVSGAMFQHREIQHKRIDRKAHTGWPQPPGVIPPSLPRERGPKSVASRKEEERPRGTLLRPLPGSSRSRRKSARGVCVQGCPSLTLPRTPHHNAKANPIQIERHNGQIHR